ncbi:MAG: hypothetical protein KC609_00290 [Myxococcales bacterium]|nr:hypothetical protein [Myxococcales bacterium]
MNNRFETNKGLLPKFQHEQKFLGVCIGWVIDNKDPDKQGRVKLKVPWLRNAESDDEDFTTDWCRVRYFYAGKERGQLWVPEIDDEVLVGFEHGSWKLPYVIGRLWNGIDFPMKDAPTDGNDNKWIQTRVGHQFIMKETGPEAIQINDGPLKNHIALDKDADNCFFESDDGKINVYAKAGKINIEAKEINKKSSENTNHEIGATYNMTVSSNANWNISSTYTIEVGSTLYITSPVRIVDPTNTLDVKAAIVSVQVQKYTAEVGTTKIMYGMVSKDLSAGGKDLQVQGSLQWVAGLFDMAAVQFGMEASGSASFTGDAVFQMEAMKGAKIYSGGNASIQGAMIVCKGSAVWCAG